MELFKRLFNWKTDERMFFARDPKRRVRHVFGLTGKGDLFVILYVDGIKVAQFEHDDLDDYIDEMCMAIMQHEQQAVVLDIEDGNYA